MELVKILKILLRWSWLIFLVVLVTVVGLTAWSNSAQLVYEARVKLQLSAPQQEDVAAFDQYRSISLRDEITVARNNFIEIVQDYEVHDKMVSQHNLDEDDATYDLEVVSERDTDFINVIVQARTPQLAALIANTLVEEAITYSGELRAKPTNAEKSLYADQMEVSEEEFRAAENAFTEFKAQNSIASLEGEIAISQSLLEQLQLANDQRILDNEPNHNDLIIQIDKMIAEHQDELDRLTALQPMYSILEQNAQQARDEYSQILNESVSVYTKVATEEKFQVAEDTFSEFKSQNDTISLQSEISTTQRLLEQLRIERDQRILEEPTLSTINTLISQRQMELDRLVMLQPMYNLLEENASEARARYQHILSKYTEAELKAAVVEAANFIQIVHPAQVPEDPVNNPKILLYLGIAGSLGFGVLLAFFLEYILGAVRDTKIIDEINSQSVIGLKILGIVPPMKNGLYQQNTPEAEAFRQLRTRIQLSSSNDPVKKILITSPQPGDGKTAISANLGIVMAESRSRVVLVDSDMRNPNLHEALDLPNLKGLADLLEPSDPVLDHLEIQRQMVHETHIPGLSLLSAGTLPEDPLLLLTSTNAPIIFQELSHQFDIVLIDTPPLLTTPDATILAKFVDGVIIVLEPNTGVKVAQEAINVFGAGSDLPILGVVLNRTSQKQHAYGYYKYQDYQTRLVGRESSFLGGLRKSPKPNLISEAQASKILGVRLSTVKRWRREGRLLSVKRGFRWWIKEDELRESLPHKIESEQRAAPESIHPAESQASPLNQIENEDIAPTPTKVTAEANLITLEETQALRNPPR